VIVRISFLFPSKESEPVQFMKIVFLSRKDCTWSNQRESPLNFFLTSICKSEGYMSNGFISLSKAIVI